MCYDMGGARMRNITAVDVLKPGTLVVIKHHYYEGLWNEKSVGVVISQEQEELNKLSGMIIDSKFRVLIDNGIYPFYWYELQVDDEV
jgi:hypothetical protein